jgi:hypothetical protein
VIAPPDAPKKGIKGKGVGTAKAKAASTAVAKPKAKPKAKKGKGKGKKMPAADPAAPPAEDAEDAEDGDKIEGTPIRIICCAAHKLDAYAVQIITKGNDKAQLVEFKGGGQKDQRLAELKGLIIPLIPRCEKVKEIPKDILVNVRTVLRAARSQW